MTKRVNPPKGWTIETHTHERGQLLCIISGNMRVITDEGSWITPPGQACWVPSESNHLVTFTQSSEFRTISIRADLLTELPKKCCVIKLSPLLRELIITAVKIGWEYRLESYEARLMQLLVEKISLEREVPFFIPEGRDSRLKKITSAMHENVRIDYTLNHWSNVAGASTRTLSRLFELEMGMSFSTWRQQLCLIRAIEMLLKGKSITETAFMLGYSSAGNFTSMFTQAMSKSPTAYLKDWNTEQTIEPFKLYEFPHKKYK